MTRVLILGGSGMLGHALLAACRQRFETWATIRSSAMGSAGAALLDASRTLEQVDATRFQAVADAIDRVKPCTVINAIGVVKQAPEASDAVTAIGVNGLFPHQLARACRRAGIRLIHISTDCVFSGRRGMYREEDPADAEDLYGRSKRLGEVTGAGVLTLRTSFIGRELSTRRGLLEWCRSQAGGRVQGYTRAVFSGLSAPVLARLVADLVEDQAALSGLYHVGGDPIDKCRLLTLIRDAFGLALEIEPVDAPVVDRSLDSSLFRQRARFHPPDWPTMIAELARDASAAPVPPRHAPPAAA